tara:strand:- start:527 stop:715 length:189 start_codon:yes stop_codon:yes gene_type:complete
MQSVKIGKENHLYQEKEASLTDEQVSHIVRILIQETPNLESLFMLRDGLNSYLSVYEKDESS